VLVTDFEGRPRSSRVSKEEKKPSLEKTVRARVKERRVEQNSGGGEMGTTNGGVKHLVKPSGKGLQEGETKTLNGEGGDRIGQKDAAKAGSESRVRTAALTHKKKTWALTFNGWIESGRLKLLKQRKKKGRRKEREKGLGQYTHAYGGGNSRSIIRGKKRKKHTAEGGKPKKSQTH